MERIAYARLYATICGVLLTLLGFGGLLANSEFQAHQLTSDLLGLYTVNGWANVFHVAAGLVALFLARARPRLFAVLAGLTFTFLGVWGILATNGTFLFDVLPAARWVNLLNLLIGLVGLGAYAASRWDRITATTGGLGAKFEARAEIRRQTRRRRKIRKRRRARASN